MRGRVIALADGVWRLPAAPGNVVNAFALRGQDGTVTLVDAGLRTSPRRVLAGLATAGLDPQAVTAIVVTHAHADHVGGLARLRAATRARVVVHERDAIHVRTGRPPGRDGTHRPPWLARRLLGPLDRFTGVPVDQEVRDGELLPGAGGLRVIHTPGHTPGHVCLLHQPTRVLFVGEALVHLRRLSNPWAAGCTNAALARSSVSRLTELDFDVAAFAHGTELRAGAREAIRAFYKNGA